MLAYQILFAAVFLSRFSRLLGFGLYVFAVFAGFTEDLLDPVAILSLALFTLLAFYHRNRWLLLLLVIFAATLENFLLPGFHNLRIFDQVHFTDDALPFTMYLNFDKVSAGLLLYILVLKPKDFRLREPLLCLLGLIGVLIPVALAIHFVRFEPKLPPQGCIWALNNLLFVALSEEALFRGLIQGKLENFIPRGLALAISAALFGLAHYRGGFAYMALACVAGIFYGITFTRTKSIEASMLVHFGLNLTHFLLFTYPALA